MEKLLAAAESGAAFAFEEGTLVKALRGGFWLLLDEINLAPPEASPSQDSRSFFTIYMLSTCYYAIPLLTDQCHCFNVGKIVTSLFLLIDLICNQSPNPIKIVPKVLAGF